MALRPVDQIKLDNLNDIAIMLSELEIPEDKILEKTAAKIGDFESSANGRVVLKYNGEGVPAFHFVDLRSDYVRTRFNGDDSMLSLRAKITGVPVDIKVKKDDDVFTNKEVASALRELADVVAKMPVEMVQHGHDDWSRTPGEQPKKLAAADDSAEGAPQTSDQPDESVAETAGALPGESVVPDVTAETQLPGESVVEASSALPGESVAPVATAETQLPGESVAEASSALPGESVVTPSTEQSMV